MNVTKICAGLALCTALVSSLAFADAASGPFTQAQADQGHLEFNNHCAECHRPNLKGGLGPSLIDDSFKEIFEGKKVSDLRDFIYENMPQTAPKSLKDEQLDSIVSWIMFKNGVKPGDKPMSKDVATSADFTKQ